MFLENEIDLCVSFSFEIDSFISYSVLHFCLSLKSYDACDDDLCVFLMLEIN